MKRLLLFLSLLLTLAATAAEPRQLREPLELKLVPYRQGLRTLEVVVRGTPHRFLFDTGGGLTIIGPGVAREIGCRPWGQLTGFRMSGERLDMPRCGPVAMFVEGLEIRPETGVMNLATLLPEEWPQLDGALSLHSFANMPMTLDLRANRLILETPRSLAQRVKDMQELQITVERATEGRAVDVFLKAGAEQGDLCLLVDSGNIAGLLLADHAVRQLGLGVPPADRDGKRTVPVLLKIQGLPPVHRTAQVTELIHDGALDVKFLETLVLTLDLQNGRAWGRPRTEHPAGPETLCRRQHPSRM